MIVFPKIIVLLLWLVLSSTTLLLGCSSKLSSVISTKINTNHPALALSAERRLVIGKNNQDVICAEPSPDATQSLLSIFSLGGKGTGLTGKESELGLTDILQTVPFQLFARSQGVQFYRDSIFALCQMAMNNWVSTTLPGTDWETEREYRKAYANYTKTLNEYYENYNKNANLLSGSYNCTPPHGCNKPDPPSPPKHPSPDSQIETKYRQAMESYYDGYTGYTTELQKYYLSVNTHNDIVISGHNQKVISATEKYNISPTSINKSELEGLITAKEALAPLQTFPYPPKPPMQTELEYAMQETRKEAQKIIMREVSDPEVQRELKQLQAKLTKALSEAKKSAQEVEAKIKEAQLQLLKEIFKQLNIEIK